MEFIPTKEEIEQFKKQILKLFAPEEELFATQVSIRLDSKIGGRKVLKESKVISFLGDLVKEERLSKKGKKIKISGHEVNATVYFLPRK